MSEQIKVTSLVSGRTADPIVSIEMPTLKVQLDAEAARQLARQLIEACEASIGDAFLFEFAQTKLGMTAPQAVAIMRDFRAFRLRLPQAEETRG